MAYLTKDKVSEIIQKAPAGTTPAGIVAALRKQGNELEGYNMNAPEDSYLGDLQSRGQEIKNLYKMGEQGDITAPEAAFRTVGQVAGGVGDVIARTAINVGKAVLPKVAERGIATGVQKIVGSKPVQAVVKKGEELSEAYPRTAGMVGAGLNIASVVPLAKIPSTSAKLVSTGAKTAKNIAEKKAVSSLENVYRDTVFATTKSAIKKSEKSLDKGKDIPKFLADKRIIIDIEDGKYRPKAQIEQLNKDASALDEIMDDYINEKNLGVGQTTLDKLETKALKAVDNPRTQGQALVDDMKNQVKTEIGKYRGQYKTNNIDLKTINEIKKGQWQKSRTFDPTEKAYVKDVHRIIGHQAKEIVEDMTKDDNIVKKMNDYIGDHYNAMDMLDSINGNAVKGGRLTKLAAMIGASTLGNTVVGKVLWTMGAGTVMSVIQSNTIANPVKRFILERMAKYNPKVYDELVNLIKETKTVREQRKLLPAPTTIYGEEYKGGIPFSTSSTNQEAIDALNEKYKYSQALEKGAIKTEIEKRVRMGVSEEDAIMEAKALARREKITYYEALKELAIRQETEARVAGKLPSMPEQNPLPVAQPAGAKYRTTPNTTILKQQAVKAKIQAKKKK